MDKTSLPRVNDLGVTRHARFARNSRLGYWPRMIGMCFLIYISLRLLHNTASSNTPVWSVPGHCHGAKSSPYGIFPKADDPFLFQPCTDSTILPALDDEDPAKSWSALFDPKPEHWSWGNNSSTDTIATSKDPYAGRGIYMCGYIDVPLDYLNGSEPRIARLAVTKFQASGLARIDGTSPSSAGTRSERTIIIEPGGPGGSGTSYAWRAAEQVTQRFSDGAYDVLGWDPRGVNASLPAISCFPYDADRDRWSMLTGQYIEVSDGSGGGTPRAQLEVADAMNDATFRACKEKLGDLPRFVSTAVVARDLDMIRQALGEDEVTGYFVSYGTGIGQTYANMFPDRVGRLILDGTEYVRDHRQLGGFGITALDNATDAWHDGFIGECLNAGPEYCALAKPLNGETLTVQSLQARLEGFIHTTIERPIIGYTESSGPMLITYSNLVAALYSTMYNPKSWQSFAQMLSELEAGNSTLASIFLDKLSWEYDPTAPAPSPSRRRPSSEELGTAVICADAYDAPLPSDGLDWWESLWANMTQKNWIAGNSRFFNVLPCRHFTKYWPKPSEVYRGALDHPLINPVLLIAETHDPATPLRNGRRLLAEMKRNARLIVHHGYGHATKEKSNCTEAIARAYIMEGKLPEEAETNCYADEKPYLYDVKKDQVSTFAATETRDPVEVWSEHLREMAALGL